jgi:hypothetical protein
MSLLDTASLIVTPNGYKASKLYSIVPSDGTGDLTWTRTGNTATRVNSSGVIETVNANIPRLDYTDSTCPKLLLEPQRTNLLLNSATLSTQSVTTTAVSYTLSFYGTGTIILSGAFVRTLTGTGASNRVSTTFTSTAAVLILTVTGSVTNAQLEVGAFATSYIPTTSATVTRNMDGCSKTAISSILSSTEGTLFVDFVFISPDAGRITIDDGSTNNRIWFTVQTSGISIESRVGGAASTGFGSSPLTIGTRYKTAIAYKNNDFAFYINGSGQFASSGTVASTFSKLSFDSGFSSLYFNNKVNSLAHWKTRLSNSELVQLTTI